MANENGMSADILAEFESDTCVYKRVKDEQEEQVMLKRTDKQN